MVFGPRVALRVTYLTSGSHSSTSSVLHFFQVTEQTTRPRPQKRIVVLVDRATYAAELDTAINRCVLVSQIEEMCLYEEHLRPLTEALTQYDALRQMSSMLDFIRTIPAVFKPNDPRNPVTMFELDESQPILPRVNCRPASLATADDAALRQQEVIRRIRQSNHTEVARMKDALQRTKDDQVLELLDAQTQIEQLKHSLALSEAMVARLSQRDSYLKAVEAEHGYVPSPPARLASQPRAPSQPVPPAMLDHQVGSPRSQPVSGHSAAALLQPQDPPPAQVNIYTVPGAGPGPKRKAPRSSVAALVDQLSGELEAGEAFLRDLDRRRLPSADAQHAAARIELPTSLASPRTPGRCTGRRSDSRNRTRSAERRPRSSGRHWR
eukprot:TRINITY_DN16051_c0_g1_i1.p1 TRINITY_DN16051_c0_g1~~TRINITY_DN16051_c0_g1_i1.p1  ORF type:complete len:398 (+),score=127.67 TRINITY_DN16051_c0_g1_i1:56-1195(+)